MSKSMKVEVARGIKPFSFEHPKLITRQDDMRIYLKPCRVVVPVPKGWEELIDHNVPLEWDLENV